MASNLVFATATRNALANAMKTFIDNGLYLVIRDGSSNILAAITIPSPPFGAASSGVITKAGTWSTTVTLSGTATTFIISPDGTTPYISGTVGMTSGYDLNLDNNVLVSGGTVTISTFTITQPTS